MPTAIFLTLGLLAANVAEYARPLGSDRLDQATLDAEGYGKKEALGREGSGLRIKVAPGDPETGWKTPQALRIGGDFTITASLVLGKLPKPAQENGVAVGIALATQSLDQPDATLVRLVEMDGSEVYRTINQAKNAPQMPQQMMMMFEPGMGPQGGKPPKPPRPVFPAAGRGVRFELRRVGPNVEYYASENGSDTPRYLGQILLGTNDLVGVKLFASNRNGGDAFDVLLRGLTVRAARIAGLGTTVRTVFGETVYGEPAGLENGSLLLGAAAPGSASGSVAPAPADRAAARAAARAALQAQRVAMAANGVVQAAPAPAPVAPLQVAPAVTAPATPAAAPSAPGPSAASTQASAPGGASPASPKASVPLDQIETIVFDRALAVTGRYVGQPNVDLTGPGGDKAKPAGTRPEGDRPKAEAPKPAPKADDLLAPPPGTAAPTKIPKVDPAPSGIRDLHFVLSGLRNAEIKEINVNGQTDKGSASYRIDTSNSTDWPLVVRRAGVEPWADVFLEPPEGDAHQKGFTFNIMYADGQNANASVQVEAHTDPKLAYDPAAPGRSLDVRVFLAGDEQLFGRLDGLEGETLRLTAPWGDKLEVPLARVSGLYIGLAEHKESPESFARRLKSRGTDDLLLARSKDGEVVAIPGVVEGTDSDKLLFSYQEKTRTLPLKQVEGLVLAARPQPRPSEDLRQTFTLVGGLVVNGRWEGIEGANWKVETAWGQVLTLPAADVQSVRFRGGQMTSLADLEPIEVEETPYFGRRRPWRRDATLSGEPIRIDGVAYARGVSVQSRTVLTYDLDARFVRFEALVGFDESARGKGRVDCRVLADGKELYANPDLRGDGPPARLTLPVEGVRRLALVVDFGEGEDTGDRLIWADPRLYRRLPPGEAPLPADPFAPARPEPAAAGGAR